MTDEDRASERERDATERLADHASIERLTDELIPALIAKLGASGLGEIEVREGAWKVRLRRPTDAAPGYGRRASDRTGRHGGAGRAPDHATAPQAPPRPVLMPVGPGRHGEPQAPQTDGAVPGAPAGATGSSASEGRPGRDPYRVVAASPAVGFYQPRAGVAAGSRVRAGDPIASIDVLGIPQEVVAPADGIVGASLVEPGEAVEYGQELVWVELLTTPPVAGEAGSDGRTAGGG